MPDRSAENSQSASLRKLAWWIAVGSALLIVYGSLFPFRFADNGVGLVRAMLDLSFRRTTRGDIVANLLLYMPLGVGLVLTLRPRGALVALLGSVAGGLLLSFAMEVLQTYTVSRVSSLNDLVLNVIGTLAGSLAGLALGRFAHAARLAGTPDRAAVEPAAAFLLLLWLCFRLAPFVPTIDWQKYKNALKPLLASPDVGAVSVLSYAVGWVAIDYALRLCAKPLNRWIALLLVAGIVLAGRVVVVDKTLSLAELIALPAALLCAGWLSRFDDRTQSTCLAALVAAVVVLQGLEPFTLWPVDRPFGWVPFGGSLTGGLERGYMALFEKAFWYTALIWLWTRAGLTLVTATSLSALLLTAIEIVQKWLPGRSPEITDPVLAIALALLLRTVVRGHAERRPAIRRSMAREP